MKRIKTLLGFVFLLFGAIILASCGDKNKDDVKLPENNYEKVTFAFNGVEKSLKNKSTKLKSQNNLNALTNISQDTLDVIFSKMEETSGSNPKIEYNETPLIQFQYLKSAYEKFGEKLTFNTKYSYDFEGDIYYDFDTDEKVNNNDNNYKHHYNFTFSMLINIDDNDLITSSVGMDVTFTHDDISRHEYMYVDLELDYNMNQASPSFKFLLKDITDILSFPEDEQMATCEYNYIDVDNNNVKEYRKFGVASKQSLDEYQNDDFTYKYNALSAYKNNKEYKLTNPFTKDINLKEAVISGLGLKDSFASYKSYFNNQGTSSDELREVIDNFNRAYGSDFVYSVATSGKDEEWEGHEEEVHHNQFISLRDENEQESESFQTDNDFQFKDIMNGKHINLYQDNYELLHTYNNLDDFDIYVKLDEEEYKVNQTDSFLDILDDNYSGVYRAGWLFFNIILEITSPQNEKIRCELQCNFMNEDTIKSLCMDFTKVQAYINKEFLIEDIIPTFTSTTSYYTVSLDDYNDDSKALKVIINAMGGTEANKNNYINVLKNNGFTQKTEFYSGDGYFVKRINSKYILKITTDYNYKGVDEPFVGIVVTLIKDEVADVTLSEYIANFFDGFNFTIPKNDEKNYKVKADPTPQTITIDNAALSVYQDYVASFANAGFNVYEMGDNVAAYQYVDKTLCRIQTRYTSIILTKTPIVFSFVGSMNDWVEANTDYEFVNAINNTYDGYEISPVVFTYDITFNEGDSFKIMINHSWSDGEFSFNQANFDPDTQDGMPIDESNISSYFESEGQYFNIKVLHAGTYRVTLYVEFFTSDYDYETYRADKIKFKLLSE